MRRNAADILFVYHYTHRPVVPFLPSVSASLPPSPSCPLPSLSPFPHRSFFPFLASRFSYAPRSLVLPLSPLPPSLVPLSPLLPVTPCIYFILLLNKPLPVILAPTCVFTRTRDPRQTQSPLDARIGLRDRSRHEKYFFSTLPFVLGITLPSRVPSVI